MTPAELDIFKHLLKRAPFGSAIEFGVFRGATLRIIAGQFPHCIGVDSFAGMPPPNAARDIKDGWNPYPTGRLAAGMQDAHAAAPRASLIRGFVPDVLVQIPDEKFAFAHVDLDQYDSTLAVLQWLDTRMVEGGVVVCDDYFPDRDWLAGGAINEFAKTRPLSGYVGRKAWFIY